MKVLALSREPRLYSIRRFTAAARQRGHDLVTGDVTKAFMTLHSQDAQLRIRNHEISRDEIDVVLPRIGASVTEAGCSVLRQIESMGIPVVNPAMAIERSRDKLRALQVLAREDVQIPSTVVVHRLADLPDALDSVGGLPCVLKLLQGTQGVGVMLMETRDALESVLQTLWSLGHTVLLQQFVKESKGRDVRAFVVGDEVVTAMRREAPEGTFRSNIHRGAVGRRIDLTAQEERAVLAAARAMELDICGVDYLESHSGPSILEINSSPGFQGLETATGIDVATPVIEYLEGVARR